MGSTTLEGCKLLCDTTANCVAIDFYDKLWKGETGWCRRYSACSGTEGVCDYTKKTCGFKFPGALMRQPVPVALARGSVAAVARYANIGSRVNDTVAYRAGSAGYERAQSPMFRRPDLSSSERVEAQQRATAIFIDHSN